MNIEDFDAYKVANDIKKKHGVQDEEQTYEEERNKKRNNSPFTNRTL